MSLLWITMQTAIRCTDEWMFCRILFAFVLLYICLRFRFMEEVSLSTIIQFMIAVALSFWISNRSPATTDEDPQQKNKRNKEILTSPKSQFRKSNCRKNKKKKMFHYMENIAPSVPRIRPKTRVYQMLPLFVDLKMSNEEMYERLLKLILTESQLRQNNYPSDVPGSFHRPHYTTETSRKCVRCGHNYAISEEHLYTAETHCHYHPRKPAFDPFGVHQRVHPCCSELLGSPPCRSSVNHVSLWHSSAKEYTRVRSKRLVKKDQQNNIFALDCEMSYTTNGLEVTKVGLVGISGLTVYETFVKPDHPILDYNTMFSGVTEKDLHGVTTTLADVKAVLLKYISEDTILIGHALNNDLTALGLIHDRVIDTSVLYPDKRAAHLKPSLKSLVLDHLTKTIQDNPQGHNCIDDARACLELVLLKLHPVKVNRKPFLELSASNSNQKRPEDVILRVPNISRPSTAIPISRGMAITVT